MKNTKILGIIALALLIAIIPITTATLSVEQYVGHPSSNSVQHLAVDGNGYALMKNSNNQYYRYSPSSELWEEVVAPSFTVPSFNHNNVELTKTITRTYAWFSNNAGEFQAFEFNGATDTWTLVTDLNTTGLTNLGYTPANLAKSRFGCDRRFGWEGCIFGIMDYLVANTIYIHNASNDAVITTRPESTGTWEIWREGGDVFFTKTEGTVSYLERFSGISWATVEWGSSRTYSKNVWMDTDNPTKLFFIRQLGTQDKLIKYNQTSGTFNMESVCTDGADCPTFFVDDDTDEIYRFGVLQESTTGSEFYYYNNYFDLTADAQDPAGIPSSCSATYETSDQITLSSGGVEGWIACDTRVFGVNIGLSQIGAETISAHSEPPNSFYLEDTTWYATASAQASISLNVYNGSAIPANLIYGGSFFPNTPANQQVSHTVTGAIWDNFEADTEYTVCFTATWQDSTSEDSCFTWNVISQNLENTTEYVLQSYTTETDISLIHGLAKINEDRLYSFGQVNISTFVAISLDTSNLNNMIRKTQDISDTSGFTVTTSIAYQNNTLYIGTDDELYAFTNAISGDASQLSQDGNSYDMGLFTYDRVNDITLEDEGLAWLCHEGITGHDVRLYNRTNNDTSDSLTGDPCRSILYNNGFLYVHTGSTSNPLRIYNMTDQSLVATISIQSQDPSSGHDRISIFDDTLFMVTGSTSVSRINISDPNNPQLVDGGTCYTQDSVMGIEALSEDLAIVGFDDGLDAGLRVCDWNNQANYEAGLGYTTEKIYSLGAVGAYPQEIIRMNNDGKFAVAFNNRITIHTLTLEVSETPVNNPPIITEISTAKDAICYEENLPVQVIATDADGDELFYDVDCTGTNSQQENFYTESAMLQGVFNCIYQTGTLQTIKAWVTDDVNTASLTKTIGTSNCTPAGQIILKVLDANTGSPINGVLVNVVGESSDTTDANGDVDFQDLTVGTYDVSISKAGYTTLYTQIATSNSQQNIRLEPTSGRTILVVSVTDTSNQVIEGAVVSATDPVTALAKIAQTDQLGNAYLYDLSTGLTHRISAGKTGYQSEFTEKFITSAETNTVSLQLFRTGEVRNLTTTRGCVDTVNEHILCSPLNISLDGDNCQEHTDCLGGRCIPDVGVCSYYNYSQCDVRGMERGSWCFAGNMAISFGDWLLTMLLDYFLYAIGFAILVVAFLLIFTRRPHSN